MGSGTGTPVSQGTPAAPQSAPATAVPDTTFDAFNPPAPPGPVFDAFNPPPPDTTFDAFNPPGGTVVREGLSFQELGIGALPTGDIVPRDTFSNAPDFRGGFSPDNPFGQVGIPEERNFNAANQDRIAQIISERGGRILNEDGSLPPGLKINDGSVIGPGGAVPLFILDESFNFDEETGEFGAPPAPPLSPAQAALRRGFDRSAAEERNLNDFVQVADAGSTRFGPRRRGSFTSPPTENEAGVTNKILEQARERVASQQQEAAAEAERNLREQLRAEEEFFNKNNNSVSNKTEQLRKDILGNLKGGVKDKRNIVRTGALVPDNNNRPGLQSQGTGKGTFSKILDMLGIPGGGGSPPSVTVPLAGGAKGGLVGLLGKGK